MSGSVKRLLREFKNVQERPVREFTCYPLEDNMFEWHFTIMGPMDSPYEKGFYHGRILVPSNYPFAPPDVVLLTPNGRFELEKRICLSISSYHPENWHPTWGITTVLHALREFMLTPGNNAIGAIDYPKDVKERLALESVSFKCPDCEALIEDHKATLLGSPPTTESDKERDKDQVLPTPDLTAKKPETRPANDGTQVNEEPEDLVPQADKIEERPDAQVEQPLQQDEQPPPVPAVPVRPPVPRRAARGVEIRISVALLDSFLHVLFVIIAILLFKKAWEHQEVLKVLLRRMIPNALK